MNNRAPRWADLLARAALAIGAVLITASSVASEDGDADSVVPLQESLNLKQKLDAVGARSALHVVPGGVHGKFNEEQRRAIEQHVLTFLRQQSVLDE